MEFALHDDPPLRAMRVLRHDRVLERLEEDRRRGRTLQKPDLHAPQGRVRLGKLRDDLRKSRHAPRIVAGSLNRFRPENRTRPRPCSG